MAVEFAVNIFLLVALACTNFNILLLRDFNVCSLDKMEYCLRSQVGYFPNINASGAKRLLMDAPSGTYLIRRREKISAKDKERLSRIDASNLVLLSVSRRAADGKILHKPIVFNFEQMGIFRCFSSVALFFSRTHYSHTHYMAPKTISKIIVAFSTSLRLPASHESVQKLLQEKVRVAKDYSFSPLQIVAMTPVSDDNVNSNDGSISVGNFSNRNRILSCKQLSHSGFLF